MKASLLALLALTVVSLSAHAIPPVPPSPTASGPTVIKCADINSLSAEELDELEEISRQDSTAIISFDQESREICYKY